MMEDYVKAIQNRDLETVKKLFPKYKFNIDTEDYELCSALHYSILYDKVEYLQGSTKKLDIVNFFIESGANIERYNFQPSDNTEEYEPQYGNGDLGPLAFAVVHGRYDAANLLLKLGANPRGLSNTLDTPLIHAALIEDEKLAKAHLDLLLSSNPLIFNAQEIIDVMNFNLYTLANFTEEMVKGSVSYHKDYFFGYSDNSEECQKKKERREKFLRDLEENYKKDFSAKTWCTRLTRRHNTKEKCGKEKYREGMCQYHYFKKRSECVHSKVYGGKRR